jgi:hypothetical protein
LPFVRSDYKAEQIVKSKGCAALNFPHIRRTPTAVAVVGKVAIAAALDK